MRIAIYTLVLLVAACMLSCSDHHSSFSRFADTPAGGWAYGDTIRISAEGLDSTMTRRIEVAVRHNSDYPYSNLWLEVSYRLGNRTVRDTVSMELADRYGRWQGKGFGPSHQIAVPLTTIRTIPDSTEVWLRHIMRVDTLRGIDCVGLTISSVTL